EVFFVWGNKDAFRDAARALKGEVGASGGDWGKVLIMGKQLCPDDPMFAEAAGDAGGVDLDLEATGATALDFPFDDREAAAEPDFDVAEEDDSTGLPSVDFDFDL